MNLLNHRLEGIESAGLGSLDLERKLRDEVLSDDAVRRGEECQNAEDEETLIVVELFVPVDQIAGKVELFGSPKAGLRPLVCKPDLTSISTLGGCGGLVALAHLLVPDWEQHETVICFLQQIFLLLLWEATRGLDAELVHDIDGKRGCGLGQRGYRCRCLRLGPRALDITPLGQGEGIVVQCSMCVHGLHRLWIIVDA